jgi:TolB protein
MTIDELTEAYQQLHERLLRGELDEDSFKAQVEQLRFEDDQATRWKIGWYTGQWYRYSEGQWVQAEPSKRQKTVGPMDSRPQPKEKGTGRSTASWLAPVLIGLLILAAAALVVGWYAGWWGGPAGDEIGAANTPPPATTTALPTATAPASPTAAVQPTQQPTLMATAHPGRAAPSTVVPSPTAAPSATPSPEPTSASNVEPSASPTVAAMPALAGQIFFPVYDPERQTFDIYVFHLDSGEWELVVEQASQPAISPDGERLAYRSWNRDHRSLQVQELADGHTWTWINFSEAARPSWSPDNQNIVFPSQQEPDREWRIYYSLGLEFDRVRRHGGDILGRVPAWLADGRIVYWECPLNKCGIYVMQNDGTSPLQLTTFEDDTTPAGSPDGGQVAFMSNRDENWEIYVASTHPHGELSALRLTTNQARDGLPTWSPDGKWLAFVSDRDGPWAVWVMRPDGSGQRKLFDLGGPLEGDIARVAAGDQHGWTWESIAWGR